MTLLFPGQGKVNFVVGREKESMSRKFREIENF